MERTNSAQSLNRIMREYKEICSVINPYWYTSPLDIDDPYEWHFTIKGPRDSDFENGMYHGRIILPRNYPLVPPSVIMLTQSGRFEIGKKVCLSASNYHPELWQPAWGLRTMLDALHAFFPTPGDGAISSLEWPPDIRIKLAKQSTSYKCTTCGLTNKQLIDANCSHDSNQPLVLPPEIKSVGYSRLPKGCVSASPGKDIKLTYPVDEYENKSNLKLDKNENISREEKIIYESNKEEMVNESKNDSQEPTSVQHDENIYPRESRIISNFLKNGLFFADLLIIFLLGGVLILCLDIFLDFTSLI